MQQSISDMANQARQAYQELNDATIEQRNEALEQIALAIEKDTPRIMEANALDLAQAREENCPAPMLARLQFGHEKIVRVLDGLRALQELPDPLGKVQYAKELTKGLRLYRCSCPIGVIGIIFESRPDALVQISSLCLKSGNAVLLKGGHEAERTNTALLQSIRTGTAAAKLPTDWCSLLYSRQDVAEMLKQDDCIDLIIPRGSNAFVKYIMQNSSIPVLGHSDGLCHLYIDKDADLTKAVPLAVDSKTQNLSVCNATETMLVHRDIASTFLPAAVKALRDKCVTIRGDERVRSIIDCDAAVEQDWMTEYLDAILSIKVVDDLAEAIAHINHYGSHHTDCIVSESHEAVETFMNKVDSADVFANCSTRFSDGYLFGFGAEVGIATGKIHARGPMGLEGLCTYKYRLYGDGQTLADLREGKYALTHQDIEPQLPQQ